MFNSQKYKEIRKNIEKLSINTKIIAISKNHPKESVEEAIVNGVSLFGENRVQEAIFKFDAIKLSNKNISLHLTGPLQTNKVKKALDIFDVFHTLDREKLVKELSKYPDKIDHRSFFIQVNTGKESSKSGVYPEDIEKFYKFCLENGIKKIEGLMCVPPINEDPKKHFKLINQLTKDLGLKAPSIGMSSDYLDALEFRPKYIRLGTVLFGERQ